MKPALKILSALLALPLLLGGIRIMLDPSGALEAIAVTPEGAAGMNTVRGAVGGLLGGSGAMIVLGLVTRNTTWFLATAVMMAAATLGRVVGIGLDGISDIGVRGSVAEIVICVVLVAAHAMLKEQ